MESSGHNTSTDISNSEGNTVHRGRNIGVGEEDSSAAQSSTGNEGRKRKRRSTIGDYNEVEGQQMLNVVRGESSKVNMYGYDKETAKDILAKMLIVDELPFDVIESESFNVLCKTLQPHYEGISLDTIVTKCMDVYSIEKEKLRNELAGIDRISIACDMWTSIQTNVYIRITAHYVDTEWQLQKKILNFVHVPRPHSGAVIALTIHSCLLDWKIEDKILTITWENAFKNDAIVRVLHKFLTKKGNSNFRYGVDLFYVRCCAHVLNLIVQEGLNEIKHTIVSVRESIKFVTGTEERKVEFANICERLNLPTMVVVSDTTDRWNTTYFMLKSAIEVKEAFVCYAELDKNYVWLPHADDWRKVEQVFMLLSLFYNATNVFSGSKYPTSNLFLLEIWKIKHALKENSLSPCDFMRTMVDNMQNEFDKYWSDCNVLILIAVVFDPRCKLSFIEYIFKKIYPDTYIIEVKRVKDKLHEIYNFYVESSGSVTTSESDSTRSIYASDLTFFDDYEAFVAEDKKRDAELSELQVYLRECRVQSEKGTPFDVLSWWRQNTMKYRTLSRMARDILAIPMSTMASEEAFDTSRKMISSHCSNLAPETIEALICAQDWLRSINNV